MVAYLLGCFGLLANNNFNQIRRFFQLSRTPLSSIAHVPVWTPSIRSVGLDAD